MNGAYLVIAGRLRQELEDLVFVIHRVERIWEQSARYPDDSYIDATALNLHGFYSGIERMFEVIAVGVDQTIPEGSHWHIDLLRQMSVEIPGVRPAVIEPSLRDKLDKYRGFRHVVRNVYTYNLDADLIDLLVRQLPETAREADQAMSDFADLLEKLGQG